MRAKSLQLCLTLCDPMDSSPPGSSVRGILQARILEWTALPSSRGIFQTQGPNPHLFMSPALAGRFFTTSATWEVLCFLQRACQDNLPWQQKHAGGEDAKDSRYIKVWPFVCSSSHKHRFRRKTSMSVFSPRSVCDLPVRVTSLRRMNLHDD